MVLVGEHLIISLMQTTSVPHSIGCFTHVLAYNHVQQGLYHLDPATLLNALTFQLSILHTSVINSCQIPGICTKIVSTTWILKRFIDDFVKM